MPFPTNKVTDTRLATTEAGLSQGYLIWSWNMPLPTLSVYADHQERVDLSDGAQSLRGWRAFTLSWRTLSIAQTRVMAALVEAALDTANGVLFATIDKGWNATGTAEQWIDVSGRPVLMRPTSVPGSGGLVFQDVILTVRNLTIVNDPASF